MASVTFPAGVGGDGSTVSDDANPTTGLANGGHRTRFVPALAQMVAVAQNTVTQATNAASSATAAATSATSAINSPGTQATSTSSVAIGTGSKSLTLAQTGKAFVVGQYVQIVSTASPTNWMVGAITAFTSGTGAMTVNVITTGGTGTIASWTVTHATPPFITPPVDSMQVFTSSSTWTCPVNVSKIRVTVVGGGGSGASQVSQAPSGGGGGGAAIAVLNVTAGTTYTVTIGAGGAALAAGLGNRSGNAGGSSSFSGSGITTVSATGGAAGAQSGGTAAGGVGSGGDLNIRGGVGTPADGNVSTPPPTGGGTLFSGSVNFATTPTYGAGSAAGFNDAGSAAGANGVIVVEY